VVAQGRVLYGCTVNDGDKAMSKDYDEQRPSKQRKQQQKREAEAAQALGITLVELPAAQFNRLLDKIELPDTLHEALLLCRTMKAREGRRRQLQYIGKLMRNIDVEPIQQMMTNLARGGQIATAQLHHVERWRERLLTEGDEALKELLRIHPEADASLVEQLIVSAHKELSEKQPPRAARKLFKYLRALLGG
jgi:ribosome-associated protein